LIDAVLFNIGGIGIAGQCSTCSIESDPIDPDRVLVGMDIRSNA
jgi:hypothetical protein